MVRRILEGYLGVGRTVTPGNERSDSTGDGVGERGDRSQSESQLAIRKKCNQRKRKRKRKTQRRSEVRLKISTLSPFSVFYRCRSAI
jgi:hypothetical protein